METLHVNLQQRELSNKSCIAKKHLSHQDYVDCVQQVEGKETCSVRQTNIKSFRP